MSNLELRIEEEASLNLTLGESSDMSFHAVDFVGIPFAPTVEVEDIEGGHRVSITSMGADGKKTDEFDVMDGATWLSGNILIGELAEGTVLTADDAYTAPPKGVSVAGKSEQASYTGINIWDEETEEGLYNGSTGAKASSTAYLRSKNVIPVVPGNTYYCKRPSGVTLYTYAYGSDMSYVPGGVSISANATFTVPEGIYYFAFAMQKSQYGNTYANNMCFNVSDPAINGTYEPYTGGKPAPNPDYPQPIESVDDLTLWLCGKNLFAKSGADSKVIRGMTNSTDGSGAITISGTFESGSPDVNMSYGASGFGTSANYYAYVAIEERNAFYLPAGTYTFSATVTNRAGAGHVVLVIGNIGQTVMTGAFNRRIASGTAPQTFTTTGGLAMLIIGTSSNVATVDTTISNIQLELGSTATTYAPYVGQSIPIPLSDHIVRSLPDGTRDTLTLTYQGPSTREGWGVFSKTLVQNVGAILGSNLVKYNASNGYFAYRAVAARALTTRCRCSWSNVSEGFNSANMTKECVQFTGVNTDTVYVAALESHSLDDFEYDYPLSTPITHDLGTVELPVNPAPDLTAWADGGSAQPTLSMGYERALSIVIPRIEAQLADLATS